MNFQLAQYKSACCLFSVISWLLIQSSSAVATPQVELWGVPDCSACVKIREALKRENVKVITYDLRDRSAEDYYLRTFGRGDIPVARIGKTVIRGNKLEQILDLISFRNKGSLPPQKRERDARSIEQNEQAQICSNGQMLESFYESERYSFPAQSKRLPERSSDLDLALDLCYGTAGWLKCKDSLVPYSKLSNSGSTYQLVTTAGEAKVIEDSNCQVFNYQ